MANNELPVFNENYVPVSLIALPCPFAKDFWPHYILDKAFKIYQCAFDLFFSCTIHGVLHFLGIVIAEMSLYELLTINS